MMDYDERVDYLLRRIKEIIERWGGKAELSDDFIKASIQGLALEFTADRENDVMPIYVIVKKEVLGDVVHKRKRLAVYTLSKVSIVSTGLLTTDLRGLISRAKAAIAEDE